MINHRSGTILNPCSQYASGYKNIERSNPTTQRANQFVYPTRYPALYHQSGAALDSVSKLLARSTTHQSYQYGIEPDTPSCLLLAPAIFGSLSAFILGFHYFGHPASGGYSKYIFFTAIFGIMTSLGAGFYIYELLLLQHVDSQLYHVVFPLLMVILFFATTYNLTYSLYPFTFEGTIGETKIGQFISFLSLSIGSISVGDTFNVTPQTPGTQVLAATEAFWNLFTLSLLISLLV